MTLTLDTHIHSNYSCDAHHTLSQMCQAALAKGFTTICFTEHVDMNPKDEGYMYYDHEAYTRAISSAQREYAKTLTILQGIEFGEPHIYPQVFEQLANHKLDFVLGSVHWIGTYWPNDQQFVRSNSVEQIFTLYYQEVMKAVTFDGFDALAHLDFPKRYLGESYEPLEQLSAIMRELVARDIALELNSSPIRKGCADICPSDRLCSLYADHGGRHVTVGSDAHRGEDIGRDFDRIRERIARYDFTVIYFSSRDSKHGLR